MVTWSPTPLSVVPGRNPDIFFFSKSKIISQGWILSSMLFSTHCHPPTPKPTDLQSQHLGARDRRIRRSRTAWAAWDLVSKDKSWGCGWVVEYLCIRYEALDLIASIGKKINLCLSRKKKSKKRKILENVSEEGTWTSNVASLCHQLCFYTVQISNKQFQHAKHDGADITPALEAEAGGWKVPGQPVQLSRPCFFKNVKIQGWSSMAESFLACVKPGFPQ